VKRKEKDGPNYERMRNKTGLRTNPDPYRERKRKRKMKEKLRNWAKEG